MWYICAYLRRVFYYLFRDKPISTNINLFKKKKNKLFLDVVTGDKTRMNNFQPQRKFNNKVWMTKLEKSPFDAKPCRSTKWIPYAVFFDREDVMWQCSIAKKKKSPTEKINKCKLLHKLTQQYKNKLQKLVSRLRYCCTIFLQQQVNNSHIFS